MTYTATCSVAPNATGMLTNTLQTAAANDTNPANDAATDADPLTPVINVAVTKSDGVTIVNPGATTTYTIAVSNAGPSEGEAVVEDPFPAACTGVTWSCTPLLIALTFGVKATAPGPMIGWIDET